jgi:hypothetical protein
MNTPCPICNHLLEQRRLAFIKREYAALAYYEHQHEIHRAKCDIMQEAYYLGLWQNARVVFAALRPSGRQVQAPTESETK